MNELKARVAAERAMVSIAKAMQLTGVSRRTVYNWLGTGRVDYIRTPSGAVRIFLDTLFREPTDLSGRKGAVAQRDDCTGRLIP